MGDLKVTDRRMFTPDGRLREPFERELAESSAEAEPESAAAPEPQQQAEAPPAPPASPIASGTAAGTAAGAAPGTAADGLPALPAEPPPGLLELVDFLAQLALASMGEVPFADGRLTRDLEAARFYIDLIGAVHKKYALRLSTQELRFLESYLDQLRLRFVSRSGA
jgi:hypothetical protein